MIIPMARFLLSVGRPGDVVIGLSTSGNSENVARAAAVRVILVTNQRWLSYPARNLTEYARVHARLEELLAAEGARLDAAYFWPHDRGCCDCRKLGAGMLRRAAREHRFSRSGDGYG